MRKALLMLIFPLVFGTGFAQTKNNSWTSSSPTGNTLNSRVKTTQSEVYDLDLDALKQNLTHVTSRENSNGRTNHMISFPTADGTIEAFRVVEASVMHPDLAAKYPGIKSYAGQGIDDPSATIRFSLSDQKGFHGMILSGTKGLSYIDPTTEDLKSYRVYARKNIDNLVSEFQCMTDEEIDLPSLMNDGNGSSLRTNDKKLRKYRLAMSCTAEYGNIFAGSGTNAQKIANILAQMNITMTRVNGVYERDLAITMELIANNDAIMYYGATNSDPWTNEYNNKTQQVIDAAIGDSNYDIGHNFNTTGGGNAGCIGCVCTSGSKGSGYTGRSNPTGDAFDIDYVAHEIGHQFGGYHTQSNSSCRSGSGATEVEPGSGSSIMGYAGICSANVQNNSDAYFNYVNIRDISSNIQTGTSSTCAQITNISNNPPSANAGANYSIPKSTAFVLRGQGSDPDGDAITYTWEQNDPENPNSNSAPSSTRTSGPMFRSKEGTTSPDRYMPQISDVVAGNLTPTWEVVPSVARSMEFALTVRDNKAGGGQTDDDLMTVTVVNVTPFTMSAPNTNVTWNVGQTETVTWNVGSTGSSPINCANVNILLSTDGGYTYPITLLSNTANDGSANITVPNNVSTSCRVMVAAADNIFYDISNTNFSIEGAIACNATVPTGLAASSVGSTTATLNWNAVAGASYQVRHRATGTSTWTTTSAGSNSLSLTGLSILTEYEAQVRSVCTSSNSSYSSSVVFTTTEVQLNYCSSNGNNTSDEYIGRVQLGSIDNSTGAGSGGYADHTNFSTNLIIGDANTITVTPTWTGTVYNEGYAVWIDYNQDGDFTDSGEQVWSASASKTTPVGGSFTVPGSAAVGNTRLRVSMKYNGVPSSCESFDYGEVEDYTVNIQNATADTEAPSVPGGLATANITETSMDLTWNASTDNVGVTGYNVYLDGSLDGTTTGTSYAFTGLTAGTSYTLAVSAVDAAANESATGSTSANTLDPVTGCVGGVSSFPYSEGFESGIGAWTQSTADDLDWTVDASGTPSSSTGPSSATEGSNYLYVESSGNGTGFPNKVATISSPCYDLSAESAATFSFSYHMYGSTMGSLNLQASVDGSSWASLWSLSGNQGNAWSNASIDLAAYVGGSVQLRFVGTTNSSYTSDMAIDKLNLSSGASGGCTDVTLTLTLDNYPAETSWSITDDLGSTVMSGGSYTNGDKNTTKIDTSCLEDGCYTFTINDSYGDGICCSYGNGSYALEDASSNLLASGGAFTSSQATNFCLNSSSARGQSLVERFEPTQEPNIYPNPASTMLYVNTPADLVSIRILTVSGLYVSDVKITDNGIDVSNLKTGVYIVSVLTEKATINSRFIKN
ncbi:Por secretion system C-terminal sorting domain-containing protein [Reichenbachiella faecimaris]|uniref:Por secretion system C-terminal sorting domain-containing protein n=1 Tax=Reichenbachiella faecimaris TaxID=692418 RepID=A0A1W2G4Z5_REIFA|nr:zinc-dependent metalloprotease family protein [Reichenbachiella faecimaris]SMD31745.1 Por secretion system C-terminal sorting domain-containing protein [Reichenbachiella faecimaris]